MGRQPSSCKVLRRKILLCTVICVCAQWEHFVKLHCDRDKGQAKPVFCSIVRSRQRQSRPRVNQWAMTDSKAKMQSACMLVSDGRHSSSVHSRMASSWKCRPRVTLSQSLPVKAISLSECNYVCINTCEGIAPCAREDACALTLAIAQILFTRNGEQNWDLSS